MECRGHDNPREPSVCEELSVALEEHAECVDLPAGEVSVNLHLLIVIEGVVCSLESFKVLLVVLEESQAARRRQQRSLGALSLTLCRRVENSHVEGSEELL